MIEQLVPSFVRKRYAAKFAVSILFVVVVIGLVGAVGYAQIDTTVADDTDEQLGSTAQLQANAIADWLETMEVQTRSVSASAETATNDTQDVQRHLVEEHARLSVDVRAIHYVDTENGSVETSTTPDLRGKSFDEVEEPWTDAPFRELSTSDVWQSERSYESIVLGDQVMAFASPVADRDDRAVVLIGTLEWRVTQLYQPNAEAATVIVDDDGTPVLQDERANVGSSVSAEAVENALRGRGRSVTAEEDGVVRAYAPVGNTEMVAVTSVPAENAYAVRNAVGQYVVLIVFVALFSLATVGVVLWRQTVDPLVELREHVDRIKRGNLDVDPETDRVDEIGRLYDAFSSLVTELDEPDGDAGERTPVGEATGTGEPIPGQDPDD